MKENTMKGNNRKGQTVKRTSFQKARTAIYVLFSAILALPWLMFIPALRKLSLIIGAAEFILFGLLFFIGFKYFRCPHCGRRINTLEPLMHGGCECPACKKTLD